MVADPAMAKRRIEIAPCLDCVQVHGPAEVQIEASAAGVKVLRLDLNQTGRTALQNLLLHQDRRCGESEQESKSTIHGSSGRLGRAIGVIVFGITTATRCS